MVVGFEASLMMMILMLLIVFAPGVGTEEVVEEIPEWQKACRQIDPTNDIMQFCNGTLHSLMDFEDFFNAHPFGSPKTRDMDKDELSSVGEICDRYKDCPKTNRLRCFLPDYNVTTLCTKVKLLQGPVGDCMRKFRTKTPKSAALESYLKDWTNYGQAKKCTDLKSPLNVMEGMYFECGEPAEVTFQKHNKELKQWLGC